MPVSARCGSAVTDAFPLTTAVQGVRPVTASNVSATEWLVVWQSYVDGSSWNDVQEQRPRRPTALEQPRTDRSPAGRGGPLPALPTGSAAATTRAAAG